jgi:uncharacterized OB-fold protein
VTAGMRAMSDEKAPVSIDPDNAGYFAGLARGSLLARMCVTCGHCMIPWVPQCPLCGSREFEEKEMSGVGTLYSWVRVARQLNSGPWNGPFSVGTVELAEGPRVLAILECEGKPSIGRRVRFVPGGAQDVAELHFVVEPDGASQ